MGPPSKRNAGVTPWPAIVAAMVVATIAFLTFRHTLGHEFVNWDDDVYVYENPALHLPWTQTVGWAFSHFYYYAYIPITLLSHLLDARLWGMNPQGHHLSNVLLHAANSIWILVLGAFLLRGESRAAPRDPRGALFGMTIAAILFAVHPLRAESVSWVSDRKDLLCAFFFIPGVVAYLHATREGGRSRPLWLLASFLLFVLAVLSKAVAVAFPLVLLLLDWIRGRKSGMALLEKVPFLLVSLVITSLSLTSTRGATKLAYILSSLAGAKAFLFPFYVLVLSFPLLKSLAPVNLAPIYPRVGLEWTIAGFVIVTLITTICVVAARKGTKAPLAAWIAYIAIVVPNVMGLSSGMQPLADRYSYLSTIPLYLLLGAGLSSIWEKAGSRRRLALAVASGGVAAVLISVTARQSSTWRSSTSLWEPVVASHPVRREYTDAYLNLGAAYVRAGRHDEAAEILGKAAAVAPENAEVHYNLGIVSYLRNDPASALACLRKATALDPRHAKGYFYRAIIAAEMGLDEESVAAMVQAARLGSKDAREALGSHGMSW